MFLFSLAFWSVLPYFCLAAAAVKECEDVVQLVLVQDASSSYDSFTKELKKRVFPQLTTEITSRFPRSSFGFAAFSDWASRTKRAHDYCYSRISSLTTDVDALNTAVESLTVGHGGDTPETSLLAVELAATDPAMGWSTEILTDGNKRVSKVIVLATDADSLPPDLPEETTDADGSPTGVCRTHKTPTAEHVGQILRNNRIFFVGLISHEGPQNVWKANLARMGTPGVILPLEVEEPGRLIEQVLDGVRHVTCGAPEVFITTTAEPTTEQPPTTAKPWIEVQPPIAPKEPPLEELPKIVPTRTPRVSVPRATARPPSAAESPTASPGGAALPPPAMAGAIMGAMAGAGAIAGGVWWALQRPPSVPDASALETSEGRFQAEEREERCMVEFD